MTVTATTQPAHAAPHEDRTENRAAPQPDPDRRAVPWAAAEPGPAAVDPGLLAILRCPLTGGTLLPVDADRLMSDRPFRDGVHPVYPVAHGIPCLRPVR